jgi:cyclase
MKRAMTIGFVLLVGAWTSLVGQQAPPPVVLTQLAGPVYMLTGAGGNMGVVADPAGMLLVDAQMEGAAGQIRDAIKSLPGGTRVRLLVNTHWHPDHTDGNKALGIGAAIIAHENVRTLIARDVTVRGQTQKALPDAALPDIAYSDTLTVYAGGMPIRLVHYLNAHTSGDTVVYIDSLKIVQMGDMFFNGLFPFIDVDNGGDIDNWVKQLDLILGKLPSDAKIIPGHGPLGGVTELRAFRQMLVDSANLVRTQMKAGKTLAQIQAAGVPASMASWTKGFLSTPQWLELVYQALSKGK